MAPLSVQLLGGQVSPVFTLPPGEAVPVSLARGLYQVSVTRPDGSIVEEGQVLVESPGFKLLFGCPGAHRRPDRSDRGDVPVRFANTTKDCGEADQVEFYADGRLVASVAPGRQIEGRLPRSDVLLEVVVAGRRVFQRYLSQVSKDQSFFHGCTDPWAPTDGIAVVFQNETDRCPDLADRRHLTLWVDDAPRLGLPPSGKGVVYVKPGRHDFQVRVGMSRQRVISGARDVSGPFRVRYGCGQ